MKYSTTNPLFLSILMSKWLKNTSFCAFYKWKNSFVQVPTLAINCTNAITHRKTRLFDCFTVKQPICATVKSVFKSHKCKIQQQNGYFCVFCRGKSDWCNCQLRLEITQMRYSTAQKFLLCISQWKVSFVQVPTLTLNCTNTIVHRKIRLFECFTAENPICANANSDFKLHKCNIIHNKTRLFECFTVKKPIYAKVHPDLKMHKWGMSWQITSFYKFYSGKWALFKRQLWLYLAHLR